MAPDELRALADALEPMAQAPRFDGIDIPALCDYLRAQADARPVAWMQEGWGPDCGPYVEFYRDDEMGWRDRKEWTPLYAAPAPQLTEAQREQKPQHEPAAVPAKE